MTNKKVLSLPNEMSMTQKWKEFNSYRKYEYLISAWSSLRRAANILEKAMLKNITYC